MKNIAAIILAAGKGKRMKSDKVNKVVLSLGKKQMILHAVDRFTGLGISPIVVVVGFAKESVIKILEGKVVFAHQARRLGTAHAVSCALKKLPQEIKTVLVVNGDDSAFYSARTIKNLIETHLKQKAAMSFLTIKLDDPSGLGRVIRNQKGMVVGIVEEKDAAEGEKKIKEINPACYTFEVGFLRKYLKKIKKSSISGEYYLTALIDIAIKNNEKVVAVTGGKISWRGINTPDELKEAEKLFLQTK